MTILPIFLNISVSRINQMGPLPTECHIYKIMTELKKKFSKLEHKLIKKSVLKNLIITLANRASASEKDRQHGLSLVGGIKLRTNAVIGITRLGVFEEYLIGISSPMSALNFSLVSLNTKLTKIILFVQINLQVGQIGNVQGCAHKKINKLLQKKKKKWGVLGFSSYFPCINHLPPTYFHQKTCSILLFILKFPHTSIKNQTYITLIFSSDSPIFLIFPFKFL